MLKWNWTPKAYRLRDRLVIGACLVAWVAIVAVMFIQATN